MANKNPFAGFSPPPVTGTSAPSPAPAPAASGVSKGGVTEAPPPSPPPTSFLSVAGRGDVAGAAETITLYGVTGTWKTSQIVGMAERTYRDTGKKTLAIIFEPASAERIVGPARAAGLIDTIMYTPDMPGLYMARMIKEGKLALRRGDDGQPLRDANRIPVFGMFTPQEWDQYGAVAIDTLDQLALYIMSDLAAMGAKESIDKAQQAAQRSNTPRTGLSSPGFEVGNETFGSNSPTHYGTAGRELLLMMQTFPSVVYAKSRGSVKQVIYCLHEAAKEADTIKTEGGKEKDRAALYGPELVGREATMKVGQQTGHMFHLEPVQAGARVGVRVWFQKHRVDPMGMGGSFYPATIRATPEVTEAMLKEFPEGLFDLGNLSVAGFLDRLDTHTHHQTNSLISRMREMDKAREARVAGKSTPSDPNQEQPTIEGKVSE